MSKISFGLYTLSVLFYNLTGIEYLLYLAFLYSFINCINKYRKNHNDYNLIELIVYSIIIPSNYIILLVVLIVAICKLPSYKLKTRSKNLIIIGLFVGYFLINIIINGLMPINTLFYLLYFSPLVINAFAFKRMHLDSLSYERVIVLIKSVLKIQGIGIVTKLIFDFKTVTSMIDFDWVTGTFGEYQGNVFFFFCAYCFILFLERYLKQKKDIKYLFITSGYMIMTGSIALIVLFAVSVGIYCILSLEVKAKTKFKLFAFMGVAICFFLLVTPAWIKAYMVKMYQADDKSIYISKIADFENVFFNPNNSLGFELFGAGIGQYASRAALTCTGLYIDSYNIMFSPSMSKYTQKYIYNKLVYVYEHRLGIVDTPFSQYISIKGELGLIGLVFLIIYFARLLKDNRRASKVFIIFVILSCFTENYLEFGKIATLLYMIQVMFANRNTPVSIKLPRLLEGRGC